MYWHEIRLLIKALNVRIADESCTIKDGGCPYRCWRIVKLLCNKVNVVLRQSFLMGCRTNKEILPFYLYCVNK